MKFYFFPPPKLLQSRLCKIVVLVISLSWRCTSTSYIFKLGFVWYHLCDPVTVVQLCKWTASVTRYAWLGEADSSSILVLPNLETILKDIWGCYPWLMLRINRRSFTTKVTDEIRFQKPIRLVCAIAYENDSETQGSEREIYVLLFTDFWDSVSAVVQF